MKFLDEYGLIELLRLLKPYMGGGPIPSDTYRLSIVDSGGKTIPAVISIDNTRIGVIPILKDDRDKGLSISCTLQTIITATWKSGVAGNSEEIQHTRKFTISECTLNSKGVHVYTVKNYNHIYPLMYTLMAIGYKVGNRVEILPCEIYIDGRTYTYPNPNPNDPIKPRIAVYVRWDDIIRIKYKDATSATKETTFTLDDCHFGNGTYHYTLTGYNPPSSDIKFLLKDQSGQIIPSSIYNKLGNHLGKLLASDTNGIVLKCDINEELEARWFDKNALKVYKFTLSKDCQLVNGIYIYTISGYSFTQIDKYILIATDYGGVLEYAHRIPANLYDTDNKISRKQIGKCVIEDEVVLTKTMHGNWRRTDTLKQTPYGTPLLFSQYPKVYIEYEDFNHLYDIGCYEIHCDSFHLYHNGVREITNSDGVREQVSLFEYTSHPEYRYGSRAIKVMNNNTTDVMQDEVVLYIKPTGFTDDRKEYISNNRGYAATWDKVSPIPIPEYYMNRFNKGIKDTYILVHNSKTYEFTLDQLQLDGNLYMYIIKSTQEPQGLEGYFACTYGRDMQLPCDIYFNGSLVDTIPTIPPTGDWDEDNWWHFTNISMTDPITIKYRDNNGVREIITNLSDSNIRKPGISTPHEHYIYKLTSSQEPIGQPSVPSRPDIKVRNLTVRDNSIPPKTIYAEIFAGDRRIGRIPNDKLGRQNGLSILCGDNELITVKWTERGVSGNIQHEETFKFADDNGRNPQLTTEILPNGWTLHVYTASNGYTHTYPDEITGRLSFTYRSGKDLLVLPCDVYHKGQHVAKIIADGDIFSKWWNFSNIAWDDLIEAKYTSGEQLKTIKTCLMEFRNDYSNDYIYILSSVNLMVRKESTGEILPADIYKDGISSPIGELKSYNTNGVPLSDCSESDTVLIKYLDKTGYKTDRVLLSSLPIERIGDRDCRVYTVKNYVEIDKYRLLMLDNMGAPYSRRIPAEIYNGQYGNVGSKIGVIPIENNITFKTTSGPRPERNPTWTEPEQGLEIIVSQSPEVFGKYTDYSNSPISTKSLTINELLDNNYYKCQCVSPTDSVPVFAYSNNMAVEYAFGRKVLIIQDSSGAKLQSATVTVLYNGIDDTLNMYKEFWPIPEFYLKRYEGGTNDIYKAVYNGATNSFTLKDCVWDSSRNAYVYTWNTQITEIPCPLGEVDTATNTYSTFHPVSEIDSSLNFENCATYDEANKTIQLSAHTHKSDQLPEGFPV